jgi:hypothetical protein
MSGPLQIRVSLSEHAVSAGNKRKRQAAELVPSFNDLERGVNTELNLSNKGRDFQSPVVSAEEVYILIQYLLTALTSVSRG